MLLIAATSRRDARPAWARPAVAVGVAMLVLMSGTANLEVPPVILVIGLSSALLAQLTMAVRARPTR
jgi:hypothetical protein